MEEVMSKRHTATEKWDDPWYRRLPVVYKLLWSYLCDRCDNAGVWKVDYDLASFCIGEAITIESVNALNQDKERVKFFDNGNLLLIKDFIQYQIGDISQEKLTNLQINSLNLVIKYIKEKNLKEEDYGYLTGSLPLDYGYKYINIKTYKYNKGLLRDEEKKEKHGDAVLLTKTEYDKLVSTFGQVVADDKIRKLDNYIGSKGKKYKSHYKTILVWSEKDPKPKVVDDKIARLADTSNLHAEREKNRSSREGEVTHNV